MRTSKTNKYLITAVLLGIIFHGTSMFFTLERTYDALIHLFFANHYATSWFEPWSYSWYTGFSAMGYPPLVHQTIGVLSLIGGLKFGMFTVALLGVILFITGVYRFTKVIIPNEKAAGYAAIMAVFSTCFVETLHVFGQLPSIIGISILMHALPEVYKWLKSGKRIALFKALALLAITVTSHHVTPIFGMVFFIFPLIGTVIMDAAREKVNSNSVVTFSVFAKAFWDKLRRIIIFGTCSLILIIVCILPYWINTKNNPITQVPIPHGSRDNFLEVTSSGLVFFIIPWGVLLLFLPYFLYRFYSRRLLFFGFSFSLLFILGTGGTTPIPLKLLGENAFNILTLDRFTLWASIMALPLFGEFCYRFTDGDYKEILQKKWGAMLHRSSGGFLAIAFIFMAVFTMTLGIFRPIQPDEINMKPIVNFLNEDDHDRWRYLPLGFGDQMAWLSVQTNATTVDGNYHSARRLPELTSRAVERLENSKYRGIEGLGSLQQFLTVPEKFHLKYVFSNDKFYDPLLYFTGWHRLSLLENGITVWEKAGITPLPSILPKDDVPLFQKLMWGIIPIFTVILSIFLYLRSMWFHSFRKKEDRQLFLIDKGLTSRKGQKWLYRTSLCWSGIMLLLTAYMVYGIYIKKAVQLTPESVITAYYDALDFKEFERAHSYIDPASEKDISQFMLEVSVTDGLLNSYAKMDSIAVSVLDKNEWTASAVAKIKWITPLKEIQTTDTLSIKKHQGKWYIVPKSVDPYIPPDQLMLESSTRFFNHGKRKITSEQTFHEDVLKQPVVEVTTAKMIQRDSIFYIVGSIQNVDNIPADIAVTGALYDSDNNEIARYNAQDIVKHKLLAKETTPFLIQFDITYDKDQTFVVPTNFEVQVKANVATTDLHQTVTPSQIQINGSQLEGFLFNPSIEAATIPQLLLSYYNDSKELIWTESIYIDQSVRPQRKRAFSIDLPDLEQPIVVSSSLLNISVNGLPNESISDKVHPNRNTAGKKEFLIPIIGMPYSFISITTNSYIGNPR